MQYVPIHQVSGLYNHFNELIAPEGALAVADNVLINRDNVAESRPGFSDCSLNFPDGLPRQLYSTQEVILCHVNNELWYQTGDCSIGWTRIGGGALIEAVVGDKNQVLWGDRTYLYFANSTQIRRMRLADLFIDALAGDPTTAGNVDATGAAARFTGITGIAGDQNYLYVTCSNHVIRRVDKISGAVTTFAGVAGTSGNVNGIGALARLNTPGAIAVSGTTAYFIDQSSTVIRTMDTGTANVGAAVIGPLAVTYARIQAFGNHLFIKANPGMGTPVVQIWTISPLAFVAQINNDTYWYATDGTTVYANRPAIPGAPGVNSYDLSGTQTGTYLFGGYAVPSVPYCASYYTAGTIYILYTTYIDAIQISNGMVWTVAGTKGTGGTTGGYGTLPIIEP